MLSFRELERAARVLTGQIAGDRLQQLTLPDDSSVVLTCYGKKSGRQHVRLSCRPGFARVSIRGIDRVAEGNGDSFGLVHRWVARDRIGDVARQRVDALGGIAARIG